MPKLTNALFKVYTRTDGAKFHGHLTATALVTSKERSPYRVMHVQNPCFIIAGDVVRAQNGEHIILMDHPNDFDWATTFKAAYAKDKLPWTRPEKIEDPVARVTRDITYRDMGFLFVNFETPEELKLEKFSETGYRFIAGRGVQVEDMVGDKVVKRIVEAFGIQVVYAV